MSSTSSKIANDTSLASFVMLSDGSPPLPVGAVRSGTKPGHVLAYVSSFRVVRAWAVKGRAGHSVGRAGICMRCEGIGRECVVNGRPGHSVSRDGLGMRCEGMERAWEGLEGHPL